MITQVVTSRHMAGGRRADHGKIAARPNVFRELAGRRSVSGK
jgi:hypothetical protein